MVKRKKVRALKAGDMIMGNNGLVKVMQVVPTGAGTYRVYCLGYYMESSGELETEVYIDGGRKKKL